MCSCIKLACLGGEAKHKFIWFEVRKVIFLPKNGMGIRLVIAHLRTNRKLYKIW